MEPAASGCWKHGTKTVLQGRMQQTWPDYAHTNEILEMSMRRFWRATWLWPSAFCKRMMSQDNIEKGKEGGKEIHLRGAGQWHGACPNDKKINLRHGQGEPRRTSSSSKLVNWGDHSLLMYGRTLSPSRGDCYWQSWHSKRPLVHLLLSQSPIIEVKIGRRRGIRQQCNAMKWSR